MVLQSGGWFALQVRSRTEYLVATHLHSKGYEEFLPVSRVKKRGSWHDVPLFPGYVFCRINPHSCGLIVRTPGVIRFVEFGGRPALIDPEEIKSVQVIVNSGVAACVLEGLHPGDRVCIQEGPLKGTIGILTSVRAKQRLVVSITMMMRAVAVEVDPLWVTRTCAASRHSSAATAENEKIYRVLRTA